jgi:hypothetical protein
MPRTLSLTDEKRRDAQIEMVSPQKADKLHWVAADGGEELHLERLIKATDKTSWDALVQKYNEPALIGAALVEGDPEIDLEQVGRRLGHSTRVFVGPGGQVLYSARILSIVTAPDGAEKSRGDFVDVEATVGEGMPAIPWSGRLMPASDVVRRFALLRKLQLRHVNGLTFDFLHAIAAHLEKEGKMLVAGAGPKGQAPLIFQTNGSPFRGFLEGRTDGPDRYCLVLHLSNLELKRVPQPAPSGAQ